MFFVQKLCIFTLICAFLPSLRSQQCCQGDDDDCEIVTQPQVFNPAPGTSVRLPCNLEPDDKNAEIVWAKADIETLMVGKIKMFGNKYKANKFDIERSSHDLIVNHVNTEDSGQYTCQVVVPKTYNVTHTVILTHARKKYEEPAEVEEEETDCPIKTQPQTFHSTVGSTVTLPCRLQSAGNEQRAVVSWIKSNTETLMSGGNKVYSDKYGANKFGVKKNSYDLIIKDMKPEDACQYTCQVMQPKIMNVTHAIAPMQN